MLTGLSLATASTIPISSYCHKNHWPLAANLFCFSPHAWYRVTYFRDVYHIPHEGSSKLRVELTRAVLWTDQGVGYISSRIHNGLVEQWTCLCSWFDLWSSFLSTSVQNTTANHQSATTLTFAEKEKKTGCRKRIGCWWNGHAVHLSRSVMVLVDSSFLPSPGKVHVTAFCDLPVFYTSRPQYPSSLFTSWIGQKKKIQPRTIFFL